MFEDDSSIHLVMQLCSGGALFERIEKERYSEKYIVLLVRSILRFISQVWSRCACVGCSRRALQPPPLSPLPPQALTNPSPGLLHPHSATPRASSTVMSRLTTSCLSPTALRAL